MIVRPAQLEDLVWIDEQLPAMQAEAMGELKHLMIPTNEKVRFNMLMALVLNHILLVAEDEPGLVGFVAVSVGPHPLNAELVTANELLYWVPPRARGSQAAHLLMEAAVEECKKRGAMWIWWSAQIENGAPAKRALERRGFKERERQWLLEL